MAKLTKAELKDRGICTVCEGVAVTQVSVEMPDGSVEIQTKFCESCEGTGLILGDDDVD